MEIIKVFSVCCMCIFASSDDFVSDNQTSGSYYSSGCFRNDLACHAGVVHKGNRET